MLKNQERKEGEITFFFFSSFFFPFLSLETKIIAVVPEEHKKEKGGIYKERVMGEERRKDRKKVERRVSQLTMHCLFRLETG